MVTGAIHLCRFDQSAVKSFLEMLLLQNDEFKVVHVYSASLNWLFIPSLVLVLFAKFLGTPPFRLLPSALSVVVVVRFLRTFVRHSSQSVRLL